MSISLGEMPPKTQTCSARVEVYEVYDAKSNQALSLHQEGEDAVGLGSRGRLAR